MHEDEGYKTTPVDEIRGNVGAIFAKLIVIDGLVRIQTQTTNALSTLDYRELFALYGLIKMMHCQIAHYYGKEYEDEVAKIERELSDHDPYNNDKIKERFDLMAKWVELISKRLSTFKLLPAFKTSVIAGQGPKSEGV
jgi:hypothetical protein